MLMAKKAAVKKKAAPEKVNTKKAIPKKAAAKPVADLKKIFAQLKAALSVASPPLSVTVDKPGTYELTSLKPVTFRGRSYPKMYFGSTAIKKNYVVLYLLYVYAQPAEVAKLSPALQKCMKGLSCFHIKKDDPALTKDVTKAVKNGLACFKKLKLI